MNRSERTGVSGVNILCGPAFATRTPGQDVRDRRALLDRADPVASEIRQCSTYDCGLSTTFAYFSATQKFGSPKNYQQLVRHFVCDDRPGVVPGAAGARPRCSRVPSDNGRVSSGACPNAEHHDRAYDHGSPMSALCRLLPQPCKKLPHPVRKDASACIGGVVARPCGASEPGFATSSVRRRIAPRSLCSLIFNC
jgi:hypothetical protein